MRKSLFFLLIGVSLLLLGCEQKPVACTMDAKVCPDGSAVGRIPPNCDFAPCPESNDVPTYEVSDCKYDDPDKKYVGKSKDQCALIKFACEEGAEYFSDDCGCGCIEKKQQEPSEGVFCKPEQREAEICTQIYQPVCGWFDPKQIQCIKYPCARTFSSPCNACTDAMVLYWTEGECPG